jgi:NAD(P)H-hydrate epimerase
MSAAKLDQDRVYFENLQGGLIPAVTEGEMRAVDRLAVEKFSLSVLQMMENAGRSLALHAMQLCQPNNRILILAGAGGNGGGGLACMRHLHDHGYPVELILSCDPGKLSGSAKSQYETLNKAGLKAQPPSEGLEEFREACLVIDALIGYSLAGPPRGVVKDLIQAANDSSLPILSLDLPSGVHATSGETPGVVITPTRTLTLALPKQGLQNIPGHLFLADIGIPPNLYESIGLWIGPLFEGQYWFEITPVHDLPE